MTTFDQMVEDGITEGKYIEASFFIIIFPRSNQPGRFFTTAKTHKFKFIKGISLESLKLCPIIDQTGTYIYNASKVAANTSVLYLRMNFQLQALLVFQNY